MFNDIKIIKINKFSDDRGYLWTIWEKKIFQNLKFNHDKVSVSKKNSLRGLHCDFKSWKLITCLYGKIFFSVVNLKKNSKKYLKSKSWILDYKKPTLVLVPPYYANGHLCLSKNVYFFISGAIKEIILMLKNKKVIIGMIQSLKLNGQSKNLFLALGIKNQNIYN